jgi:uncharacterized damage-inducible protein DinB
MPLDQQIIDALRKAHSGDPWYGPSTESLIASLSASDAADHPIEGGHSIWEIVLHMIAWQNEVVRRLRGSAATWPEEGDWQEITDASDASWEQVKTLLSGSTSRLEEQLASSVIDYDALVGTARSRELATGVTIGETVLGVLQHNAYHTGQIALLKRAIASGEGV